MIHSYRPINQPDKDLGPAAGKFHQPGKPDQIQGIHEFDPVRLHRGLTIKG
jgi:hypothetical protein